jgi:hypothetical protein
VRYKSRATYSPGVTIAIPRKNWASGPQRCTGNSSRRGHETLYLDTSSLVKLYVAEPGSDAVRKLVDAAAVVATSSVAYTETRAALARRRRERALRPAAFASARKTFQAEWPERLRGGACDALQTSSPGRFRSYNRVTVGPGIRSWNRDVAIDLLLEAFAHDKRAAEFLAAGVIWRSRR